MKEIIEEALVKFGLNRIISKGEKEEAIKRFSIPKEQNILFISRDNDYMLAITDFAIYYNTDIDVQLRKTRKPEMFFLSPIIAAYSYLSTQNIMDFVLWDKIDKIDTKSKNNEYQEIIINIREKNDRLKIYLRPSPVYNLIQYVVAKIIENYASNDQNLKIIDEIKKSLSKGNHQEAKMLLNDLKIDKNVQFYKDLLPLKVEIYEKDNDFYKVAETYQELKEFNKEDTKKISLYNVERQQNYEKYIKTFIDLPLQQRNIITISNTDKLFKSDHITLLNIEQLPAINFPSSHPKPNQTYIVHPYKTDTYLPIESYDYELLNDRMDEFFRILGCLGATSITLKTIKKENKEEKKNLKIEGNVGGSKEGIELEVDAKYSKAASTSLSKYMDMERSQTFAPNKRPYIPKDTIWFPREPRWQRLAQQRLEGGILTYTERISSSENQLLNKKQIATIGAELKMLLYSIKAKGLYEKEENLQQNEEFSFLLEIEFKPMKEFPEETEIIDITAEEVTQTPIQLPAPNDNEARYLEEIYFMLEDDGVIDERERTILERFRERYNITPERAKELEAQAIASQELTPEEQEYLSEYKNSLQDGAISERERRLLNRLAMALGISEDRVKELEGNI